MVRRHFTIEPHTIPALTAGSGSDSDPYCGGVFEGFQTTISYRP